jgi:hypothetical protein
LYLFLYRWHLLYYLTDKFTRKMKIKTFIIFALFIFFNYSVYSEDKKEAIKEYKLYDELRTLKDSCGDTGKEINEIVLSLVQLDIRKNTQNYIDYINLTKIEKEINDVTKGAYNLLLILDYERVIYQNNISNNKLNFVHNHSRTHIQFMLNVKLERAITNAKEYRIKIQNTTAVIAVNKSLEMMIKLQKWSKLNNNSGLIWVP